jgi:hypothetical protein
VNRKSSRTSKIIARRRKKIEIFVTRESKTSFFVNDNKKAKNIKE